MRLFKYSLAFFALVALLCFSFIEVKGHVPRKVEITTPSFKKRALKDAIRIYSGPDLKSFTSYSVLSKDFNFEILNQHSYGIGVRDNVEVARLIVDDRPVKLTRKIGKFNMARIAWGDHHTSPNNLLLSKLIACLILAFFSTVVFWALGKVFTERNSLKDLLYKAGLYALALAPFCFYAYVFSPALYDFDFPDSLIHASRYGLSGWFSFINYIFLGAGIIIGNFTGLGVKAHMFIQLGVVFIGVWFYLDLLRKSKAPTPSIYIFLALLWLPPMVLFSLQISRDFWTCFLPLVCALGITHLRFHRGENQSSVVLLTLAMGAACLYRPELALGAIIFVFAIFWLQSAKQAIFSAMIIFGLMATGLVVNSKIDPRASKIKLIASFSQPLGAVLTSKAPDITKAQMKELKEYVDIELMKEKHVDFEIMAFHAGAINVDRAIENLPSYIKLNLKIFAQNPLTFLRSRTVMFLKMIGATGWTSGHPDDHNYFFNLKNKNIVGLLDWEVRKKDPLKLRWRIIDGQLTWLAWAYTMLPSIFICLFAIKTYRKNSATALAAALVLSKLPVFFLLAPAAHFKYASDVYAIGLLLWPLILAERKAFFLPRR